jgi:TatD DNase family protein
MRSFRASNSPGSRSRVIDTHAHVHDRQFDTDRAQIFARAKAGGVSSIVNVGCDMADSARALAVAQEFDCLASVGIHPHEAKDSPADIRSAFEPFLENDRVVAIGETGLDYYYDHSPRETQRDVMRAQVRLARERGIPVIFHHRDAFDDFVAILREEWRAPMRGVVHCFTGDVVQAQTYIQEFGLYLGIGGVITFKTANQVRDAVRVVGLSWLVLETDCPYLAPVPYRGNRNEPSYMASTAIKAAEVLGCSVEDLTRATSANARTLFGLSER